MCQYFIHTLYPQAGIVGERDGGIMSWYGKILAIQFHNYCIQRVTVRGLARALPDGSPFDVVIYGETHKKKNTVHTGCK